MIFLYTELFFLFIFICCNRQQYKKQFPILIVWPVKILAVQEKNTQKTQLVAFD